MPPSGAIFMSKTYNIFAELKKNIADFDQGRLQLGSNLIANEQTSARYLQKNNKGMDYSQRETVNKVDLMINSKYESGLYDSEGQRKVYLNQVRFIRDVSRMRTDVDVKNYIFNPDSHDDFWGAYFMQRQFKVYARKENYGETLNDLQQDYCTYGTAVSKKVGKNVVRVPISSLRNKQDAKSLKHTAKTGGYVIEEHKFTKTEIEDSFPDWNTEGLEYGKEYIVYERYSLVPQWVYDKYNGKETNEEKMILCMQIVLPEEDAKKDGGNVLFLEQVKEAPYEEVWWEKVDGRWLGRGPVENQFENQIARNMTANMRRRALLWGSKKVFQSQASDIAKNLVKDVKDGQVLEVGQNGLITQVAMESRNLQEFSSDEAVWDKNGQQLSFTYEVATGESLPSGTPFRLGVLLNQAVETFFSLKREQFGLYAKRAFFSQMIPIFKKQSKEHTILVGQGEQGYNILKDIMIEMHVRERLINNLHKVGTNVDDVKAQVTKEIESSPLLYVPVPAGFYDNVIAHMDLDLTGEAEDTQEVIQTLTTIYQTMVQAQDPRAEQVLETILSKTGKNLSAIAGKKPPQQVTQGIQMPQMQPQLNPQLNATA